MENHLTVRDLIKALADLDPTDEVVFVAGRKGMFGVHPALEPRVPVVAVESVHRVITATETTARKVQNYAVLVGKVK